MGWQDSNLRNARIKIWCLTDLATAQYIKSGVGNRTRTGDIQNHNLALYRLNYTHHTVSLRCRLSGYAPGETRTPDPLLRRQLLYPAELQAHPMERVMGIEPTRPAWKAGILAIELHPQTQNRLQAQPTFRIISVLLLFVKVFLEIFLILFICHSACTKSSSFSAFLLSSSLIFLVFT